MHNNNSTITTTDTTKIWLVHKLRGEVVTENDPQGRPSLLERITKGGVGKVGKHKKHKQYHLIDVFL